MRKITIDDKIIQEIKELSANKEFMDEIEDLRQRAINAHLKLSNVSQEDHNLIDRPFDKEVEKLAKKYGISKLGLLYFNGFVFVGGFNPYLKGTIPSLWENFVNDEFINIQINRYTTLDDIKVAWPRIQRYFINYNLKKKRFKIKKNIDRDLEILHLKNGGWKNKDIVVEINNKYGCDISYEYISRLLARLKNRTRKNL